MVKAVIFDLDGVIVVPNKRFSERLQEDCGTSKELLDEFFEGKFQELLVGKGDLKEELKKYAEAWGWEGSAEELLEYWFMGEHVIDERIVKVIREIRGKGIQVYLATNQEKYRTSYAENEMGLSRILDGVFSSGRIGHRKEDPQFWQVVLAQIPASPEEILYWDDSEDHVEVARSFGIQAELYTTFRDFRERLAVYLKPA